MTDLSAIEPFVVKDPEAMARNMAHMVEEMGKAGGGLGRAARKRRKGR